ncbi:MAG: class I mannose-6-phosphate isomerase [Opitutales bacterium]|nr:class I mannose-6-phosphate isomerase [Opitutales bacterium]MBT5167636.1 class I mannose-6-phosphate isomerase [Opitutales bacterium]MBT6378797.1 class I mannose-6-phosphate isomerase [Opitutales bacterium]MBT6770733.1 class I mannose-6-phosphate isomerase [Opitutales bacterium]MDG2253746.1 class I mannose-6-phosphate isomerase [Opitutaceae bacterium]
MSKPIFFKPIYQERVWGGRTLSSALGRDLPEGKSIGESWDIVDRPEAMSLVSIGEEAGTSLRDLISEDPTGIMGKGYDPERPFPILVKWLDCSDRLSLQVHPPVSVAGALGGEPKTENWYIAECAANASLIVGLKNGATREEFKKCLEDDSLEGCVHRFPVTPGESILVESGRIHAIDAGNLILEIQQNSDTTYRVYDWGRVGLDGHPRQLHVEESLRCIDWDDFEPSTIQPEAGRSDLADCEEFRLVKHSLDGGSAPIVSPSGEARLISVVEGTVLIGGEVVERGDTVLLPASATLDITSSVPAAFLVTDRFI